MAACYGEVVVGLELGVYLCGPENVQTSKVGTVH